MNTCRIPAILGLMMFAVNIFGSAQSESHDNYTDHHVHLQDSAAVELGYQMLKAFGQTPTKLDSMVLDADTIVRRLDKAKFYGAWILSNAYWFGSDVARLDDEYNAVKFQNDWTAAQADPYISLLTNTLGETTVRGSSKTGFFSTDYSCRGLMLAHIVLFNLNILSADIGLSPPWVCFGTNEMTWNH